MADKKEIRRKVAFITIGKRNGETFSVHSIVQDYFKDYTVGQYQTLYKKEWNKVNIYTSELFRVMRNKGVMSIVEERERSNGLSEKIYSLTPQARAYFEAITRGEEIE